MDKKIIINEIKTDLTNEFKKNFTRKAFFEKKWTPRKRDGRGSLMIASGRLRRSIRSRSNAGSITFFSSTPYAKIHNEGGKQLHNIPAHQRKRKDKYHKVRAHQRGVNMPQRQFIGDHPRVQKIITETFNYHIEKELKNILPTK